MKRIEAIIKPFKLEEVREGLSAVGVNGMTCYEVKGFGTQKGHTEIFRGSEYTVDFLPKVMLVIYAPDEQVTTIVDTIVKVTATGKIGDGKIAVMAIEQLVRIRTGETGEAAL